MPCSASRRPSPTAGWPFQTSGQGSDITACQPHSMPCLEHHLCLPARSLSLHWDPSFSSDRNQHISFYRNRFIDLDTAITSTNLEDLQALAQQLVTEWQFSLEVKNCFLNILTPLSLILLFPKVIPERLPSQGRNLCPSSRNLQPWQSFFLSSSSYQQSATGR